MALFTRMLTTWPSGSGSLVGYVPNGTGETQYASEVWSVPAGTINYGSGAAIAAASPSSGVYQLGTGGSEVELTGDVTLGVATGNPVGAGYIVRYVDANNYWSCFINKNAAQVEIYEINGGTPILRASVANAGVSGNKQIKASGFGTTILARNETDSKEVTYSSSFNQSATICGIRLTTPGTVTTWSSCSQIRAQITLAPEIGVTHDATPITDGETTPIDFGDVQMGGTSPEETFVVSNTGVGTLTISSVTLPTGFAVAASNQVPLAGTTISEGASKNLVVKLDADLAAGVKSGDITINSDDSDEAAFNFAITGEVTEPSDPDVTPESANCVHQGTQPDQRNAWTATVTFAEGATKSNAIPIHDARKATLYTPLEFNTDAITFEGAESLSDTFYQIVSAGTAVTLTGVTGKVVELPDAALRCKYLKIVTDNAVSAAATVHLLCKS